MNWSAPFPDEVTPLLAPSMEGFPLWLDTINATEDHKRALLKTELNHVEVRCGELRV